MVGLRREGWGWWGRRSRSMLARNKTKPINSFCPQKVKGGWKMTDLVQEIIFIPKKFKNDINIYRMIFLFKYMCMHIGYPLYYYSYTRLI